MSNNWKFSQIRSFLDKERLLDVSWNIEIAVCVDAALSYEVSDDEFDLICRFVKHCLGEVDKGYTQLMADIVCDLYQDCGFGYRDVKNGKILTKEDLEKQDYQTIDWVVNMFYDRY